MKMMVKLAVLFATFLLLTGVSFADDCDCYEVTATEVGSPTHTHSESVEVCLDYGNKTGKVCAPDPYGLDLSLFFQPLGLQILAFNEGAVGSFKFHGSHNNVVTGIGYFGPENTRWTLWGHKTEGPCPVCKIPNGD